jgi:hypothetical protein
MHQKSYAHRRHGVLTGASRRAVGDTPGRQRASEGIEGTTRRVHAVSRTGRPPLVSWRCNVARLKVSGAVATGLRLSRLQTRGSKTPAMVTSETRRAGLTCCRSCPEHRWSGGRLGVRSANCCEFGCVAVHQPCRPPSRFLGFMVEENVRAEETRYRGSLPATAAISRSRGVTIEPGEKRLRRRRP